MPKATGDFLLKAAGSLDGQGFLRMLGVLPAYYEKDTYVLFMPCDCSTEHVTLTQS
jgi:hypothetical protein